MGRARRELFEEDSGTGRAISEGLERTAGWLIEERNQPRNVWGGQGKANGTDSHEEFSDDDGIPWLKSDLDGPFEEGAEEGSLLVWRQRVPVYSIERWVGSELQSGTDQSLVILTLAVCAPKNRTVTSE